MVKDKCVPLDKEFWFESINWEAILDVTSTIGWELIGISGFIEWSPSKPFLDQGTGVDFLALEREFIDNISRSPLLLPLK